MASQGAAVALPAEAAPADREFASSFESGRAGPGLAATPSTRHRTAPKRASGVDGGYSTGIPGNVTDHVTDVRASGENTGGGEVKENLVDGESEHQVAGLRSPPAGSEFDLDAPVKVVTYALTSANDHDERDPKDWTLQGSADGKDWKTLDTRTGETFAERFQTKSYDTRDAAAEYRHFRLDITKNNGARHHSSSPMCSSRRAATTSPAPEDMLSLVDRGPSGSPTAKAGAGFTGKRALRYAGTHKADGRAYSYNKVFDVERGRRAGTPSCRTGSSRRWRTATWTTTPRTSSVDLAFTDGTYLSDLRATDQHGFPLTPQGQGAAKVLYVNQWNNVRLADRLGRGGQDRGPDPGGVRLPEGPGEVPRLAGRRRAAGRRAPEQPKAHLSDYALTTRGTNSSGGFSRGNNFPATAVPHGFNFWTPVTNAGSLSWLYDYARANNADNLPTHPGVQREP